MSDLSAVRFFLGANTPGGFFGYHEHDLYDPRDGWAAFLIKSGAGTGKATFMREILDEMTARNVAAETVFCSSDPASLDAVVFHDLKLCILDATSPHILEPYAYGECEQLVPFGCCLQAEKTLAQNASWYEVADACASGHARCCRFMAAAHSLLENNTRLQERAMLEEKLAAAAKRLATREFGGKRPTVGKQTHRFLSAVTPIGHVFFKDTAAALCPKLYVLEDEYGAVSSRFISLLRDKALEAGLSVVVCPCPLDPRSKLEHLLIPSLGVGFLTSNHHHRVDFPVFRRIHAARFTDSDRLQTKKQQLAFNRRAAKELLREAEKAAADAKVYHDRMEALHVAAMDWTLWREIADRSKACFLRLADARLST